MTEHLGLKPDYLAGHSIGEIAAAHVAGALSLEDAAKLVSARGRLMGELPEGGAMIAIEATEQEVTAVIESKEKELSIAAVNGPTAIVISGEEKAAEEVQAHFEAHGKKTKRLSVSHAFHSPLIEPMLGEFAEVAKSIAWSEPQIPIISNVTGEVLVPEQATDPAYWISHARQAVRFADSIKTLEGQGVTTYIELGPEGVLTAMAATCLPEDTYSALIATLRSSRPEPGAMSAALARAHASGARLDWAALHPGARRVPLPTYPFQRERFWLAAGIGLTDATSIGQREVEHPLLAAAIEDPGDGRLTLTGSLSLATHPWLADHRVGETALLPGTAFLELALQAAEQVGAGAVEELTLASPLVLPESGLVSVQVTVSSPGEGGSRAIAIHSRAAGEEAEWVENAGGTLFERTPDAPDALDAWPPEGAEPVEVDHVYDLLAEQGLECGPAFQGLHAAWRADGEIFAEASLPEEMARSAERFAVHPALLDSALRATALLGEQGAPGSLELPVAWRAAALAAPGAKELRARIAPGAEDTISLALFDGEGTPLLGVASLRRGPLELEGLRASRQRRFLHGLRWAEIPLGESDGAPDDVEALRLEAGDPDAEAMYEATQSALETIQSWLADEANAERRLALIVAGAVAIGDGEAPDPAVAAIRGLVRSAQAEHPGRFALVDTD